MIREIVGIALIITGLFDSWKYVWQSQKIIRTKCAKGQSRKFINVAIFNDMVRIIYALIIMDWYILATSLFVFFCMIHLLVITYIYYPYRHRGLINFKRPNFILYFINSLLPNRIRRKL